MPPGQLGPREGDRPDEYMIQYIREGRFFVGCETEELTLPFALKVVGNGAFIYSSDFPHEVTPESCKHDIGELWESDDLTQADKEAILYRNAERFYRL
jgi:predicted TIM-barrel fold metal-dependent hydrolase